MAAASRAHTSRRLASLDTHTRHAESSESSEPSRPGRRPDLPSARTSRCLAGLDTHTRHGGWVEGLVGAWVRGCVGVRVWVLVEQVGGGRAGGWVGEFTRRADAAPGRQRSHDGGGVPQAAEVARLITPVPGGVGPVRRVCA